MRMKELLHASVRTVADAHGLVYTVLACDPDLADTAAFCEQYGFAPGQSANTIIVAAKDDPAKLACCVVLATTKLDVNKAVRKLLGVKKASFAPQEFTRGHTGMEIGGVTAVGIEDMPIYVDAAVMDVPEIIMGGGNRSSKLLLAPDELSKLPNMTIIEDLAKQKETV
jgi:prolyl-tRNA editing enzyme YbaK/EbsC (Cys-tRNA(Pro) deacylase)